MKATEPSPKRPDCPECNGTGERDTGGSLPWGEWISAPCDCSLAPSAKEPQGENNVKASETLEMMIRYVQLCNPKIQPDLKQIHALRAAVALAEAVEGIQKLDNPLLHGRDGWWCLEQRINGSVVRFTGTTIAEAIRAASLVKDGPDHA